jgi:hypothetical protein
MRHTARLVLPGQGVESWTVIGPDLRPVAVIDEFLAWLTHIERSPNTVQAYARDLKAFWTFLASRGLEWERVGVGELGEFAAWARRPADNAAVSEPPGRHGVPGRPGRGRPNGRDRRPAGARRRASRRRARADRHPRRAARAAPHNGARPARDRANASRRCCDWSPSGPGSPSARSASS